MESNYNNLQHYGVKGMKWGVRKVREAIGNFREKRRYKRPDVDLESNQKGNTARRILKGTRFRGTQSMSNEELIQKTRRLQLENRLKVLASNIGDRKVKGIHKNRHRMSDDELAKVVNRLNLEDAFKTQVKIAEASQTSLGLMVRQAAKKAAMSAAMDYIYDGRVDIGSIISKASYDVKRQAIENAVTSQVTKDIAVAQLNKSTGRDRGGNPSKKSR